MSDVGGKSKSERKKARRRARKESEAAGGRALEALTEQAIEQALAFAPEVAAASTLEASERGLDVVVETVDAARFIRKRVNEALNFNEWHDEVDVWVWDYDVNVREPLTDGGREFGVEVRLEKR